MQKILVFLTVLCFTVLSCTKGKTDYEKEIETVVPEHNEFKEAIAIEQDGYRIHIDALNGTFYKGYNEIRLVVTKGQNKEQVVPSAVTFLPIRTGAAGQQTSCPHRYKMPYLTSEGYFAGYSVFTEESGSAGSWDLYIGFTIADKVYTVKQSVSIQAQPNKNLNMTSFVGKDDEQYVIALIGPQKPKVASNALLAGIYKWDKPITTAGIFPDPRQFTYSEVKGYTLQLDPRMPEPSMGNHSSPNNEDLTQKDDGLYHGVVNYTMTGNWTLNFILLNKEGRILKGTQVSHDFTPGVAGAKSELFIDTLF